MKKGLIILFLSLVFNANAQFELGINTGVAFNHTNKGNEKFYDFGNYTSFYPEINAGYSINKHWSVNWGFGFFSKGYKVISTDELEKESDVYCKFRYLSIPIYVSYRYPVKSFYGKLSLGLQPNFYNSQSTPLRYEEDSQQMNHTIGLLLGVEAGYFLRPDLVVRLTYRCTSDFNDVDKLDKQGKLRSHLILAGISYVFPKFSRQKTAYEE